MIRYLGECNADGAAPEWAARNATAGPAVAGVATTGGGVPGTAGSAFDYTAAGVSYAGTPVVSWAQLALGLLALRSGGGR